MDEIIIKKADKSYFNEKSLLNFNRFQVVTNIYKSVDGKLCLVPSSFTEDWTEERKIEKANEILSGKWITYLAFSGESVVGEIMIIPKTNKNRLIIDSFHVSADYRRCGIGRMLFQKAVEEAKNVGASALYMSCCSAEETIKFYTAMGAKISENPIKSFSENQPCDIQMEYKLK